MSTPLYRAGRRTFLNRTGFHSDATASAYVSVEQHGDDRPPWVEASLTVRDCSDQVAITLDLHTAAAYRNTLAKLDKLAEVVAAARTFIVEAREVFVDAKREAAETRRAEEVGE